MDLLFFAYADQRKDLPHIKREADTVYSLLAPGVARDCFVIHPDRQATIESVSRHLTTFRQNIFLFHYSGHTGDDILSLEGNADARAEGIAHLLAQCPRLQLVVLNGCCTAGQVAALRAAGVQAPVIATHTPVEDQAAYRFAEVFYQALAAGDHAQQAFEQGIGASLMDRQVTVHRAAKFYLSKKAAPSTPLWGIFPGEKEEERYLPGSRQLTSNFTAK